MKRKNSSVSFFGGPIEIGYVDEKTGLWTPLSCKKRNTILYQGSDIIGRLLAGYDAYTPSTMYFLYENTSGTPSEPVIDRGDDVSDFLSLTGDQDFLRVPMDMTPVLDASDDDDFETNKVTFFGVTSGSIGVAQDLEFSETANSKVVSAAIVSTPGSEVSDDVIFARFNLDVVAEKLDGSQIGIKWNVQFI